MIASRIHLRNVAISTLVLLLLAMQFSVGRLPANAQSGQITLTPANTDVTGTPGQTGIPVSLTLTNNSTIARTISLSQTNGTTGVTVVILSSSQFLNPGSSVTISMLVNYSSSLATGATIGTAIISASSSDSPAASASAQLTFKTSGSPPTNTPTTTATAGPTATPGPVCPEGEADPGSSIADADLLRVDVSERHGICYVGDEDWFKFGGVGGKVYTIDIPQMDAGLDLSLELFDARGNRLTFNDDYFNRNTSAPDPKDIKPRIQSWRAPDNGLYYIRVRDTLNIGGNDTTYTIVVQSESYGPTPVTVTELCRDLFEEDGLPEQARLITSNETQKDHVLCPTGDADWVKFFGLRGKTYYIYTDTRNKGQGAQPGTEAGADTVIYLADRDGISIIDFNDDIQGSLDSELRFTPSADGFYYLQVKNVGDIGNQFIKYDLTLLLCVPGQECGRAPAAPATPAPAAATPTIAATAGASTPTTTADGTATQTAGFLGNTRKPGPMVNGPLRGFADTAFNSVWQRTDRPIAEQRIARSWIWGPGGLMARTEGYIQSASGLRQVQYFDKARMEVNNPGGDRGSRWFVTTGLLVIELISGRVQIGDNEYVQRAAADIPIAGDPGDPNAPTYASFAGVSGLQPGDRTGQLPAETIGRNGKVGSYAGPQRAETRLAHFVPESGHNIPQVFWDYLNASGTVYDANRYRAGTVLDWVFTLGYPISDPYWTRIKVGGVERDVLVQAYQRRVLTYSPDNPSGWQVEMGNVGRHYYLWRYGEDLP